MRKIYREKLNYILERLKPHEDQLKIEGALTGMHFTITVDNGLTMSQCLHSAEIEIKIKRLQLCGRKRTTSKIYYWIWWYSES